MLVEDLISDLSQLPKGTVVYIEADHGQSPEQAGRLSVSFEHDQPYYGDELSWVGLEKTKAHKEVQSVLIS